MSPRHASGVTGLGIAAAVLAVFVAFSLNGCSDGREPLRVFAADALTASFQEIEAEYEKLHPDTDILLDIHGSILLTRLVPIRRADVVAVADHRLIEKAHPAIEDGERVKIEMGVRNVNRTVGAMLAHEIVERHGSGGLADGAIEADLLRRLREEVAALEPPAASDEPAREMSPESRERLRALGYIE